VSHIFYMYISQVSMEPTPSSDPVAPNIPDRHTQGPPPYNPYTDLSKQPDSNPGWFVGHSGRWEKFGFAGAHSVIPGIAKGIAKGVEGISRIARRSRGIGKSSSAEARLIPWRGSVSGSSAPQPPKPSPTVIGAATRKRKELGSRLRAAPDRA